MQEPEEIQMELEAQDGDGDDGTTNGVKGGQGGIRALPCIFGMWFAGCSVSSRVDFGWAWTGQSPPGPKLP